MRISHWVVMFLAIFVLTGGVSAAGVPEVGNQIDGLPMVLEEPEAYRIEIPGADSQEIWGTGTTKRFGFSTDELGDLHSSLLLDVTPLTAELSNLPQNWLAAAQALHREAYRENGYLLRFLSFDDIAAGEDRQVYVMYMELEDSHQRLEVTVCWYIGDTYCARLVGINRGDMPEMFRLTKEAAASFEELGGNRVASTVDTIEKAPDLWATPEPGLSSVLGSVVLAEMQEPSPEAMEYLDSGLANHKLQEYDLAVADYDKAIALAPQWARAYHYRAISYMDSKRYEQALADTEKALELEPYEAAYYRERGHALRNLGRPEEALLDFNRALLMEPNNWNGYYGRGWTYSYLGDFDNELADYDIAISLNPYHPSPHSNRAYIYRERGEYEIALAGFQEAMSLAPENSNYIRGAGTVLMRMKRYDEAMEHLNRALELAPEDDQASYYADRALCYAKIWELDLALADYDKAIELDPTVYVYYHNKALAFHNNEKYVQAVGWYTKALECENKDDKTYYLRGLAQSKLGNYEEAVDDYTAAIAISAESDYYKERAAAYEALGEVDKARDDRESSRKQN